VYLRHGGEHADEVNDPNQSENARGNAVPDQGRIPAGDTEHSSHNARFETLPPAAAIQPFPEKSVLLQGSSLHIAGAHQPEYAGSTHLSVNPAEVNLSAWFQRGRGTSQCSQ
jgi:hypothetical protein